MGIVRKSLSYKGLVGAPGLEPGTLCSQSPRWAFVEHAGNVGSMRESMSRLRLLTVRRFEQFARLSWNRDASNRYRSTTSAHHRRMMGLGAAWMPLKRNLSNRRLL